MNENIFENVLGHLEESVFVLDSTGSIIYANDYLLKHGIMDKKEVLAINSYDLYAAGQSNINIFDLVKTQKKTVTAMQTLKNIEGNKSHTYLVTHVPVLNQEGNLDLSVGIIRDVSSINYLYDKTVNADDQVVINEFINTVDTTDGKTKPIYQSELMDQLLKSADRIAKSDATVLILGESGVGKEVLANYIFVRSGRADGKFISLNCAVLEGDLIESELFGYERGTFTGALSTGKKGIFEECDGGTIFLDEIDSLPLSVQAKLLRVLESHEIRRIGGRSNIKVDFRIIAATNADLKEKVKNNLFREDLYFRLNIIPLTIPPLRQRKEDIGILFEHFLKRFGNKYGRYVFLSDEARQKLMQYTWPGNVRELRNFAERLILLTDNSVDTITDIPKELFFEQTRTMETEPVNYLPKKEQIPSCYQEGKSLKEQSAEYERQVIEAAIIRHGTLTKAAQALGIDKSTLIRKRKK